MENVLIGFNIILCVMGIGMGIDDGNIYIGSFFIISLILSFIYLGLN